MCLCYLWTAVAFSEMSSALTIQEQAARYEMRNFIVPVQRRCGACKGKHNTLRPEVNRGYSTKLMTTGTVNDKRKSGRPFTKSIRGEGEKSAGNVYAQPAKINTSSCMKVD